MYRIRGIQIVGERNSDYCREECRLWEREIQIIVERKTNYTDYSREEYRNSGYRREEYR